MTIRRKRKLISYRKRKALLKKKILIGAIVMGATFFVCLWKVITLGNTVNTKESKPSEMQIILSDNNKPSETINEHLDGNLIGNSNSNSNGNSDSNSNSNGNSNSDSNSNSDKSEDTYNNGNINTKIDGDVIEATEIKEGSGDSMVPPTDFSDSAFIGDSRTEGLAMFTDLSKAALFYTKGLTVTRARTEKTTKLTNGSMGTVLDGLMEKEFNRIYIMFGINELGWPSVDAFIRDYTKLIEDIKSIQPNTTIFIQSILPVEASRSNKDPLYNNNNIVKFNKGIKEMTERLGVEYVDVASAISDESGALPAGVSHDGIHPNKSICQSWLNYLIETTSITKMK